MNDFNFNLTLLGLIRECFGQILIFLAQAFYLPLAVESGAAELRGGCGRGMCVMPPLVDKGLVNVLNHSLDRPGIPSGYSFNSVISFLLI